MENMAWEINSSFRAYRSKNILKTIKNRETVSRSYLKQPLY